MKNLATPKARVLARALHKARIKAGLSQVQLAYGAGMLAPTVCRIEGGLRSSSPVNYGTMTGLLLSRLHPRSVEAVELRNVMQHCADTHTAPSWMASNAEERNLQHRAFHDELQAANSTIAVWPIDLPPFVRLPGGGRVDVLVGETATTSPGAADRLRQLTEQGVRIHVMPIDVVRQHTLDCSFAVLVPHPGATPRTASSSTRASSGTFLHERDGGPLRSAELATTLRATAHRHPAPDQDDTPPSVSSVVPVGHPDGAQCFSAPISQVVRLPGVERVECRGDAPPPVRPRCQSEGVPTVHSAQPHERHTDLAVAIRPTHRRIRLVILDNRRTQGAWDRADPSTPSPPPTPSPQVRATRCSPTAARHRRRRLAPPTPRR